jgi:hypothetical protein
MDFSVDRKGEYLADFESNPIEVLAARLTNATKVVAQSVIRPLRVRDVLKDPRAVVLAILVGLKSSELLASLGVQIVDLAVLAITPTKEMARALESETRELIQQQADQAIYARRNAAVEEERRIKESELKTEIAVETKRREIRETKMAADIALEEQRSVLIDTQVENDHKEADSRAYALETTLKQVQLVDWKMLLAMNAKQGDSRMVMSMAFQELAQNAGKIGQLVLSPDLLQTLLANPAPPPPQIPMGKK